MRYSIMKAASCAVLLSFGLPMTLQAQTASTNAAVDTIPDAMPLPKFDTNWRRKFRLLGSFVDPTIFGTIIRSDVDLKKQRLANPVQLNYRRDGIAGQEVFGIKGAAFVQWQRDYDDRKYLKLSAYSFGIEVDQERINGAKTKDQIAFHGRASLFYSRDTPNVFWNSYLVDGGFSWITDSDFDLSVVTADVSVTPKGGMRGFAGTPADFGPFQLQFTPRVKLEAFHVIDANGVAAFVGATDRYYAGGSFGVTGNLASFDKLTFSLDYTNMFDLTSKDDHRELMTASLNWALDPEGRASLELKHFKGQSTKGVPQDLTTFGLGFAF